MPLSNDRRALLRPVETAFVGMMAATIGYLLAWAGTLFGAFAPVAMVAAPILTALVFAVLAAPWTGVAAVFLAIPIGDFSVLVVPFEVVQILIVTVALLVMLHRIGAGLAPLSWTPPMWWLLGIVVWWIVALPSALHAGAAIRETALIAGELVFACVVLSSCRTSTHVCWVMAVLTAVAAGVGLIAPFTAKGVTVAYEGSVVIGRAVSVFNQPNQLGTFCATTLFVAVGLALGARASAARRAATAASGCIGLGLFFSLSRGAWIGVLLALLVMTAMLPAFRRVLLTAGLPLLLVGTLFGAFFPPPPQLQLFGARAQSIVGERNPYDDRPAIWSAARRQILADPLTGQGPGSFPFATSRASPNVGMTPQDHAHNLWLTWAAEAGIPAVALLLGLTAHVAVLSGRAVRHARKAGRDRDAALIAGLTAALVALLGQGLVDYTLRAAVLFTLVAGILGALLAMIRIELRQSDGPLSTPFPDTAGSSDQVEHLDGDAGSSFKYGGKRSGSALPAAQGCAEPPSEVSSAAATSARTLTRPRRHPQSEPPATGFGAWLLDVTGNMILAVLALIREAFRSRRNR